MKPVQVGIIDIGSNSIKLLIAASDRDQAIRQIDFAIEEVRIGEGMTGSPPRIDPEAIEKGTRAVANLHAIAKTYELQALATVATSAVRDAHNRSEFVESIKAATGLGLSVLSGHDEARLIGKGVSQDPALDTLGAFILADLGGGSMECIRFEDLAPTISHSFNLGAVRLTSKFIRNRLEPVSAPEREAIVTAVQSDFHSSPFQAQTGIETAVLTGGAAAILTHLAPDPLFPQRLNVEAAKQIRDRSCALTCEQRIDQLSIPPKRADIFPAATIVLCELLDYFRCKTVYFSSYNLRYGLAVEMIEGYNQDKD